MISAQMFNAARNDRGRSYRIARRLICDEGVSMAQSRAASVSHRVQSRASTVCLSLRGATLFAADSLIDEGNRDPQDAAQLLFSMVRHRQHLQRVCRSDGLAKQETPLCRSVRPYKGVHQTIVCCSGNDAPRA